MVPFGGWDMPVEYSGIVDEHLAVRTRAGLFDVSHMGEIEIAGKDALAAVQRISSNDAAKLARRPGALLRPARRRQGTFVDDLLVYRLAPSHFLLVVNASNIEKDYAWIAEHVAGVGDAVAVDASSRYALLALQGPKALEIAAAAHRRRPRGASSTTGSPTAKWPASAPRFREPATRAKTASRSSCRRIGRRACGMAILEPGRAADVIPCGLGARDTLRLEAAMRLYGNDIDDTTTVARGRSGLDRRLEEGRFHRARTRCEQQKASGVGAKLVGFEMLDRGIARHGYDVCIGDAQVGVVTSGTQTPFLKKAIGMAYVPVEHAAAGTEFDVDIRGRAHACPRRPAAVLQSGQEHSKT